MSDVTLSIGGRNFSVACAAGEEAHIAMLGQTIDAKLAAMGGVSGQSEARILLFAALLLADELHDAGAASQSRAKITETLDAFARQLENIATLLEG